MVQECKSTMLKGGKNIEFILIKVMKIALIFYFRKKKRNSDVLLA